MPSKTKKQSKASSRTSNSEYSASPQTSTLTSSSADLDFNEQNVRVSLEEASSRFPNLIGKSAFIGSVINVLNSSRCTIWLSESAMVASSISPGSVVSVSLAASSIRSTRTFPLTSFLDELTEHFKVEFVEETASKVGDYFALATVFPSSEVAKNGVILSSSLSYTMGCPASGSVIFVHPVEAQPLSGLVYGNNGPQNSKTRSFSIHICGELLLELVRAEHRAENYGDLKPRVNSFEELHGESENISSLSPKTPLCQPKISSTPSRQASARHKASSTLSYSNSTSVDLSGMEEALKDESTKQLLQGCATSELYSRALVHGNLVAISILSKVFFFRVVGITKFVASSDQDLMKEKSHSSEVDHFVGAFLVNHKTKVNLCVPISSAAETPRNRAGLHTADSNIECDVSKLGGLGEEYAILRDIISLSMKNTLLRFRLRTTKGVLLHGPPGTGKTTLARVCVRDAGVNLFTVNGPEIFNQYHGESEQAMQNVFQLASQAAPAVVFIDELDAIAPARAEGGEDLSQRMVATLLNLMDGINRSNGLLVIAATNRPESIEPALRRPGRFDREIEIGVPSPSQRLGILQTILDDRKHSLSPIKIQQLALATHGFVGADLAALCNEAALVCLRRHARSKEIHNSIHLKKSSILREDIANSLQKTSDCLVGARDIFGDSTDSASSNGKQSPISMNIPSSSFCGTEISKETHESSIDSTEALFAVCEYSLEVSFEDFEKAKLKVRPSAMREVILEVPKVNWEDVGGQVEVKNQLKEAVLWSQEYKSALKRVGVRPPTGILMFGPPGCSKTLMARAVACEANLNFLAVKGPELFSKWVGESEKAVRSLFAKARANAPSIIFFDEIDGLAVIRGKESDGVSVSDRVMSQLLVELDGLHQRVDVTVIAATNRPDKMDPALLRPGRFDRLLYVGPPNEIDREDIFRIHLQKVQCCSDVSLKELACLTEGYTGADISLICREAATAAIEDSSDASEVDLSKVKVTMHHLKTAISHIEPSETHSYQELSNKFQRLVHTSKRGDDQKK